MQNDYELNTIVEMKKPHACGEKLFKVVRLGADIRIKCEGCGRSIMLPRQAFNKKIKKITAHAE
ncbi:DUF951 domain-containing protein [Macrococcoides bohemicum]|uniref:DUF951 domain-containing protein n=1 Tax=Macrococcoides bohemicum TaxID=1903056 RepID=A0A328A2M8_9STAP|nr:MULTISPECIES: DUF951 domain-containing protein [Macrococcus]ATD31634.1 DUF951 domain-containing protein [Macrococcus sp. IME1552]MBC9873880.1 DUF951 domain-containing protein [Macrococcus bohemicus]QRN50925.1 DUF951 domain-containing protein [Macrococcus bohemicus]QYA42370.1 DUF951 domain-containing protein [Macrococcus bohemicus]QYA44760.1 DUF951 domain-containing protein [Macrococcus bohemicus]